MTSPITRISDAELEYWGNIFQDNHLDELGISFDIFISAPKEILAQLMARNERLIPEGAEHLPPLPPQRHVRRRVELQTPIGQLGHIEQSLTPEAGVLSRNGRLVEPFDHNTYPHNRFRREYP